MPVRLRPTKTMGTLMCSSPSLFDFCRVRSVSRISACRGTGEFAAPHFGASAAGRCRSGFQMMCCRQVTPQASMSFRHP